MKDLTDHPTCPRSGKPMRRDVRPMTIACKGQSATMPMPGWYCGDCEESLHSGEDMTVSDLALSRLKAGAEG